MGHRAPGLGQARLALGGRQHAQVVAADAVGCDLGQHALQAVLEHQAQGLVTAHQLLPGGLQARQVDVALDLDIGVAGQRRRGRPAHVVGLLYRGQRKGRPGVSLRGCQHLALLHRRAVLTEAGQHEGREGADVGMVKGDRGRQCQPGILLQAVAQLHGHQRVEAEGLEAGVGVDPRGLGVAEHRGQGLRHQAPGGGGSLGRAQVGQGGRGSCLRRGPAGGRGPDASRVPAPATARPGAPGPDGPGPAAPRDAPARRRAGPGRRRASRVRSLRGAGAPDRWRPARRSCRRPAGPRRPRRG
jgi:hypothetical protein